MFDLAVVGAGIVGVLAAERATLLHPSWRVLLIERSLVGGGATRYSAALDIPFGRTPVHRRMSTESLAAWRELQTAVPDLPIRDLPLLGVIRAAGLDELRTRCTAPGLREASTEEREELSRAIPGLVLDPEQRLVGGVRCSYAPPETVSAKLARRFQESGRSLLWEGVEITEARPSEDGVELATADGRRVAARRAILSTGPWALRGPGRDLAHGAGIRVKKIAALHLDRRPRPQDPVLFFFDDDAFLLPLVERGHWLFSFPCPVWDCAPEVSALHITAEDRRLGLSLLARYCPDLAGTCSGGRVFCDAYGPDWTPQIVAKPGEPFLVVAGAGSGSGFRLGPAIARQALEAVAGARRAETRPGSSQLKGDLTT